MPGQSPQALKTAPSRLPLPFILRAMGSFLLFLSIVVLAWQPRRLKVRTLYLPP